jgi:hypothetical protein
LIRAVLLMRTPLKLLNYSLAGVLGAALASLATYRLLDGGSLARGPVAAPVAMREPVKEAVAPPADGPTVAELEELRRKNAELSAQLAGERTRREKADITLTKTREDLDELRRPMTSDVMSSALRADLKSGEVVVTGGYKLPDGTRLYAFVQPTVERVDGADVVNIASTFRMLSDETGKAVGLENLATNAANTLQHGEVWAAEEKAAVLGALETASGVRGLSYPGVRVPTGVSSVIEAGTLRLKVTPTLGADRESMDFEVRLEQTQPGPEQMESAPPTDAR